MTPKQPASADRTGVDPEVGFLIAMIRPELREVVSPALDDENARWATAIAERLLGTPEGHLFDSSLRARVEHDLRAVVISQVPHFAIFNNDNRVSFVRWTDGDRSGYGNLTIVYINEHLCGDRWTVAGDTA